MHVSLIRIEFVGQVQIEFLLMKVDLQGMVVRICRLERLVRINRELLEEKVMEIMMEGFDR